MDVGSAVAHENCVDVDRLMREIMVNGIPASGHERHFDDTVALPSRYNRLANSNATRIASSNDSTAGGRPIEDAQLNSKDRPPSRLGCLTTADTCSGTPAPSASARTQNAGVTILHANRRRRSEESQLVSALYNSSFQNVRGFVTFRREEFEKRAADIRPFCNPEFVLFAELADQTVGFGLVLPDINEVLVGLNGKLWPLGWLRFALGTRRVKAARFVLLGVLPGYAGRGIAPLIAREATSTARRLGIKTAELTLVHGSNIECNHLVDAFGSRRIETYRLYEKELTDIPNSSIVVRDRHESAASKEQPAHGL